MQSQAFGAGNFDDPQNEGLRYLILPVLTLDEEARGTYHFLLRRRANIDDTIAAYIQVRWSHESTHRMTIVM